MALSARFNFAMMMNDSAVRAIAMVVVLCVVVAVAFKLMATFRDYVAQDQQTHTEVLANLDEMRQRGDISEEEFRTMQTRARQLRDDTFGSTPTMPSAGTSGIESKSE